MLTNKLFPLIKMSRTIVRSNPIITSRNVMKASTFDYKIFSHESFNKAECKQTYWNNLTEADKQQHYAHGAYHGVTMNGKEFLKLVGKCYIILSNENIVQENLTVGLVIENYDEGIKFSPVTGVAVNKGVTLYYMSILDDSKISIDGDSLIRIYKADKLIVERIWVSDKDYVNDMVRQWVSQMPVRDANGCVNGSVY